MRIGLGCVGLGTVSGGRSWGADVRFVEEAIGRGVTVLDTADAYGNGASERIVGRAVRHRRHEIELATKGGYVFRPRSHVEVQARRAVLAVRERVSPAHGGHDGPAPGGGSYARQDFSPPALRRALEASLRRLQTEYVDVYQLHGPPVVVPELMATLSAFVEEGKVRRLGVGAESVDAAIAWSPVEGIDVVQMPVGILDAGSGGAVAAVGAAGPEVWARGVFAGGVLAAAVRAPSTLADDPAWPLIEALTAVGQRWDLDLFELALGYVRSLQDVSVVLLGMSSGRHLERNLALAAAPALPAGVVSEIEAAVDEHPRRSQP